MGEKKAKKLEIVKPEQSEMFESEKIEAINRCINRLLEAQDQRMIWAKTEGEERAKLGQLLIEHDLAGENKGYRSGKYSAWMDHEVKVKARKADDGKPDDSEKDEAPKDAS